MYVCEGRGWDTRDIRKKERGEDGEEGWVVKLFTRFTFFKRKAN